MEADGAREPTEQAGLGQRMDKLEAAVDRLGSDLRREMAETATTLKGEMSGMATALRGEMAEMGAALRAEIGDVRREMHVLHEATHDQIRLLAEAEQIRYEEIMRQFAEQRERAGDIHAPCVGHADHERRITALERNKGGA